jgi:hypothetical protein
MPDQPSPNGIAWAMQLKGDTFDLDNLVLWTTGNPVHAAKVDDRYDLVMPFDVVGHFHEAVPEVADAHLAVLNALGALFGGSFERVEVDSTIYTIDETGQRRDTVLRPTGAQLRLRGGRPTVTQTGQPVNDPTQGMAAAYISLAKTSKAAADALTIISRRSPTWAELYVAYELVEAAAGGRIVGDGWIRARELERFKHTVNSYNALGVDARHGDAKRAAPKIPMSHEEAQTVIRSLIASWLQDLIGEDLNETTDSP